MVATKSSQLKGTYVRALKDAVKGIQEAVSQIRARTMTEEVVRLEAANSKLTKEVADLRRDLQELRQRPSQPVSSEPSLRQLLEETARANAEMFGNMLNARLAVIEDRPLPEPRRRPPLAADTRSARADPAQSAPAGAPVASTRSSGQPAKPAKPDKKATQEAPVNSQASSAPTSSGKKGKSKKKSLAAQEAAKARRQPAPAPTAEPWTAVVGRKAKNKAAKAAKAAKEPPKPRPTAQKRAKLRTPRTAAVSLTLVPGVEERGVTYASILSDAKRRVSLADLGISNMRFRRAATGARLLEIGGENSAAKADSLAKKLREVLSPDAVRVVRPVKRAEIRVTGLDDSADAIEVADAVAKEGGCAVDDVKHGRIVVGPRGDGSLWISCPVAAAKRLSDSGRLLVGWTSARVRLLDSRPARCYRCLEPGHLGVKCSCEVDRSRLCFRCGQPDHQARDCTAEPHCPVCATAGKPAAHSIGGSGCISAAKPAAKSPQEKRVKTTIRREYKELSSYKATIIIPLQ
ncbi:translation initiation factor IF-2-like [Pectinophora gossypiella]|uniref:translation initiation factor IF-2-like n=1 Tax=Pectinophora gossypiella TaxID=13191 RepID=UPI00214EE2C0|nr:translation initiation factor IF-2-like [Pectinophora gossypiella]